MRLVLARNLRERMLARYPDAGDPIKALAGDSGLSRSTVQRISAETPPTGASIDIIAAVAKALRVSCADLLAPQSRKARRRSR